MLRRLILGLAVALNAGLSVFCFAQELHDDGVAYAAFAFLMLMILVLYGEGPERVREVQCDG